RDGAGRLPTTERNGVPPAVAGLSAGALAEDIVRVVRDVRELKELVLGVHLVRVAAVAGERDEAAAGVDPGCERIHLRLRELPERAVLRVLERLKDDDVVVREERRRERGARREQVEVGAALGVQPRLEGIGVVVARAIMRGFAD